jgi:hypothetical protein
MDLLIFVVTTLALVVAMYVGWRQTARPTLDYEITYSRPLLGPRESLSKAFSVNYSGGNPPDVNVFAIKLGNYGRAP